MGELDDDAVFDRSLCDTIFEFVEEEVGGLRGRCCIVQVFIAGYREYAVAAVLADAVGISEF